MATIPPKKFTLRAFRIANPNLTESNSGYIAVVGTGAYTSVNCCSTPNAS